MARDSLLRCVIKTLGEGDHKSSRCRLLSRTVRLTQVAREIQIHSTLHHEHIIALYGSFEDAKHVYLVQEFAVGAALFCIVTTNTAHSTLTAILSRLFGDES